MRSFDTIVMSAGGIGASVAYHLARLGCTKGLVLNRTQIRAGTTSQSSGILRTHYSVIENVRLAQASWRVLNDFANYLGEEEASAVMVKSGYLIAAPDGAKLDALRSALDAQRALGIEVRALGTQPASSLLPLVRT